MKIIINTFFTFFISFLFMSCDKEESLKPNPEAGASQQAGIDFLNNGGQANTGGNGGDSSVNVKEFFRADIDGTTTIFVQQDYTDNGAFGITIQGRIDAEAKAISFVISGSMKQGDTLDFLEQFYGATYVPKVATGFTSTSGKLIVDSLTPAFVSARFNFKGEDATNGDQVSITNGSFKVAK